MKEVIVYQSPQLKARLRRLLIQRWLRRGGNFLLIFAFLGCLLTYGPLLKSELEYRFKKNIGQQIYFRDLLGKEISSPVPLAPDPNFSLVIPKIQAQAKIFANVDASKPSVYLPVLKKGVAHARGTVFPGMQGTIFLFAHSTNSPWNIVRYNAVFYLLRELEEGDEVIIFFGGKRFNYRVTEKKVVPPTQTSFFKQKEEELLVLQTCHPPGTTREALLVFAKRGH